MRFVAKFLLGTAWVTLVLAVVFAVIDGMLFSEGPEGFFPTAAMFGFAGLGTISFVCFMGGRGLQGQPWLRTRLGLAHGVSLAVSILSLLALGVFR